jgi:hypothetical protein
MSVRFDLALAARLPPGNSLFDQAAVSACDRLWSTFPRPLFFRCLFAPHPIRFAGWHPVAFQRQAPPFRQFFSVLA